MTPVLLLVVLSLPLIIPAESVNKDFKHTNIVLVGATGDLAQKYLWISLFELFGRHYEHDKHAFSIYGCSRKSPDAGRQFISDILLKVILCPTDDSDCRSKKKKFVEVIQFHQLKTEKHYQQLASKINENIQSMYGLQGSPISPEDGRLVYLSMPPSAYVKTSMMVNKYLRPVVGRPWFRVVIEKPFGYDYDSAKELSEKLDEYFSEKELYRVDHYLGKTIVREVLPFRYLNKKIVEPLWNRQHIERVEIVMKEKLDVRGRLSYYDEAGVVRDVMQNHLMEMAALIGMDLPDDSGIIRHVLDSKLNFLQQVEPLSDQSLLIGQYSTYAEECKQELKDFVTSTNTPTYGAAMLSINSPRWHGVPFLLISGKQLGEKNSYIRIVFKDQTFRLQDAKRGDSTPRQVVFHISNGDLLIPDMITISKSLMKPVCHEEWDIDEVKGSKVFFGESINNTYQLLPRVDEGSYTVLLDAAYHGHRHMFIDNRSLLSSWKIWDGALRGLKRRMPQIYNSRQLDYLDFVIIGSKTLEFVTKDELIKIPDVSVLGDPLFTVKQIPATFCDARLITGKTDDVITTLAGELEAAALAAIRDRGTFHLALPGGQSPVLLFRYLAGRMTWFPWVHTHIWLVDERCVPQDDPLSNFYQIDENLLQHIPVPYTNIHPMLTHLTNKPCSDNSDQLYQSKLEQILINSTMDFTLLGVGCDGHIASLFPNQTSLIEHEKLVMYSEGSSDCVSPRRMTLTYPMLNQSKHIALLVLGSRKHDLLEKLSKQKEADPKEYPVLGLKPSESNHLVWYIDDDAFLGDL